MSGPRALSFLTVCPLEQYTWIALPYIVHEKRNFFLLKLYLLHSLLNSMKNWDALWELKDAVFFGTWPTGTKKQELLCSAAVILTSLSLVSIPNLWMWNAKPFDQFHIISFHTYTSLALWNLLLHCHATSANLSFIVIYRSTVVFTKMQKKPVAAFMPHLCSVQVTGSLNLHQVRFLC